MSSPRIPGQHHIRRGQLADVFDGRQNASVPRLSLKRRNMGQLPEQVAANLAMLERLNAQLALNNHNQIVAAERRTALRRRASDNDTQAAATPEEALQMRLYQLNADLVKLQRQYSDKYPDVINTKAEIVSYRGKRALHLTPPASRETQRDSFSAWVAPRN